MDLKRAMKAIAKASGGGRVTVELPEGEVQFFARLYPTWEQSRDLVRAECQAEGRGYPGDGSPEAWSRAFTDRHSRPLPRYGKGADPLEALDMLVREMTEPPPDATINLKGSRL